VALSRDVVIRLLGDADSAVKAQRAAADAAEVTVQQYRKAEREHARVSQAMETAARKQRAAMEDVGRSSMVAGAVVVAGLGMAVKAAVDWESAWTGVLKTVNGSPAQLAKLESGLRGLTRVLPATHTEIAAVAEAAGQLGVKTGNILEFTRVMINLGETTNLSADEAATSLAQMMNVMRTAPKDVDRLGATLVALGNAGASTEADIMDLAKRLAGAGQLIGASEPEVLALASSMANMGIQAELGGGAMSRVMLKIYSAMQQGGSAAKKFSDLAGMSAQEFADKWKSDPVSAIDAIVKGLGRVKDNGGNVVKTLGDLGISGTQNLQVMLALAGAGDELTSSLKTANKGWEQNTALIQEAAKRYDTTASKTEMARNAINDAAISIGDTFLPVLSSLAETVADVASWFAKLPAPLQGAVGGLAGIAGVGALVGGAFLLIAPRVMETYKAFQLLNSGTGPLAGNMGKLGKAAGVAAGLAVLGTAVGALDDAMSPGAASMEQYTASLLNMDGSVASLNKRFGSLDNGLVTDIDGFAGAIKRLTDPSNEQRLNDFGGALFNVVSFGTAGTGEGAASRRRVLEDMDGLDKALALMVQNGNAETAASQFDLMAAEAKKNNDQKTAATTAQEQATQAATLAQNLDVAYGSLQGYAAALGLDEDATKG
jgi:TP901 family phage tail tape measure protein